MRRAKIRSATMCDYRWNYYSIAIVDSVDRRVADCQRVADYQHAVVDYRHAAVVVVHDVVRDLAVHSIVVDADHVDFVDHSVVDHSAADRSVVAAHLAVAHFAAAHFAAVRSALAHFVVVRFVVAHFVVDDSARATSMRSSHLVAQLRLVCAIVPTLRMGATIWTSWHRATRVDPTRRGSAEHLARRDCEAAADSY